MTILESTPEAASLDAIAMQSPIQAPRSAPYHEEGAVSDTTPTGANVETAVPSAVRTYDLALLAGLASVFLANALVAHMQPDDFVDLVRSSVMSDWFPIHPGRWLAWVICVNDLVLGLVLLASIRIRQWRPALLAWSGVWLLAVTVIKLTSLDAFVA